MRKTIVAFVILGLLWVGYLAWPLRDLYAVTRAVEGRDVAAVMRNVDLHRVRQSLTQQIVDAYLKRTGTRIGPLAQGAALAIADPIVARVVSPQALAELLRAGWPIEVLPDRPSDAAGLSFAALGTLWDLFDSAEFGIGRFEVAVPVTFPRQRAFILRFRLAHWRWRLTAIELPQHIRELLADEVMKHTKGNPPPAP
jgi:DUF2939 family protein